MSTATLEHVYTPRGACHALFKSRAAEVLVAGPAGTGKSRACLEKLHLMALLNPGMRGLIVRKTATSLASSALQTFTKYVIPELLSTGQVWFYGGSPQEPPQYKYANGSAICIGGMDKATRIMSTEYDVVYVQEATELSTDDWEALTTRLRNYRISFQQLLADCNPDRPEHWLKQRSNAGRTQLIESTHKDNPLYYNDDGTLTSRGKSYIVGTLGGLTGVRRLRLLEGKWAAAEGLIYEEWEDGVHLIDPYPIPADWTRWWSVDFGFVNPFVCQMWAEDPDGRLVLYREFYMTGLTVDQHAAEILSVVAPDGRWVEPRPRAIITDHDTAERVLFARHIGMGTKAAKKDVKPGIQAVQMRLRPKWNGKPGLQIMRECRVRRDPVLVDAKKPTCTAEEVVGYVWDTKKEQPVKEDDHGMDTTRYVVAERDLPGVRIRTGANKGWR